MAVLIEQFDLVPTYPIYNRRILTKQAQSLYRSRSYPGLVVVDKENGSKVDALNAGLNVANGELVCAIDADTLIEPLNKDDTMAVLIEQFDLVPTYPIYNRRILTKQAQSLYRSRSYPGLVVVDKENGSKVDALNAGLNVANGELVCAIDADTLIEPDGIQRMVRSFLVKDDVVAAGGTIRVVISCRVAKGRVVTARTPRRPVPGFQVGEYMRSFLFGRLGWNRLGGNLIISGAFGLFRREAIITVGGYAHDTVGEDMELVLRLRRRGYEQKQPARVEFIPDPVAWTEVPNSLRVLGRQRDRWHRGLADVMWRHRRIMLNPRYGALGMVVRTIS